jgi:hypothetical protein
MTDVEGNGLLFAYFQDKIKDSDVPKIDQLRKYFDDK